MTPQRPGAPATNDPTEAGGETPSADDARTQPLAPRDAAPRPADPKPLADLLAAHCRTLGAEAGAILRVDRDGRVDLLAVHPPPDARHEPPPWLHEAVVLAPQLGADAPAAVRALPDPDELYGQPAARHMAIVPLATGGAARGLAAFVKRTDDGQALAAEAARMSLPVPAAELYALHVDRAGRSAGPPQFQAALAALAAVNEHERFLAAAMGFCNELASRWQCERVSLGFVKGRYVHLKAVSHAERFSRKTRDVQLIEAAMEECLDQDLEVVHPAPREGDFVSRCAAELSAQNRRMAVLSLPLRRGGRVEAVATLERAGDRPFSPGEVETLRLTCELCAPRLLGLRLADRWFGAKLAGGARKAAAGAVSPRHTALKIGLLLAVGAVLGLILARGEYRVEAPFVLEATRLQVVSAPFAGQIEEVFVRPGDEVAKGRVLARLKTVALRRRLNAAKAELFEYEKQADSARAEKRWAEAQIAMAKARKLREQIDLFTERIDEAQIRALLAGTVIKGKLERFVGAPVEKGEALFEIAPIESLRAELSVPEDQVADLLAALDRGEVSGSLAAESYPDEKIRFVVERVHPVAETEDGETVFPVRARLDRTRSWMRPGMQGLAHVTIDRRSYAWIWTRRLVNWLRLRLWL